MRKLTVKQQAVLNSLGEGASDWFAAADLGLANPASVGATLNSLMVRGLLKRRRDPNVWGRSQYRLCPPKLYHGSQEGTGK